MKSYVSGKIMSFAIYRDGNYYSTTIGIEPPGLMRAPWGVEIIALASICDAEAIIGMLSDYPDGYVLAHGQHSPPSYKVRACMAPAMSLPDAMYALDLQYDFLPDGSRIYPQM